MPGDRAWNETLIEKRVTYHIELDGRLFLMRTSRRELTSKRVSDTFHRRLLNACGKLRGNQCRPVRTIETSVYENAALA